MPVSNIQVIDLIVSLNYSCVSEIHISTIKNSFYQKSTHLFEMKCLEYSTKKIRKIRKL